MAIVGLLVTLLGFLIAALSVGIASGVGARLGIVVLGIAVSLFGIMGLVNPAYLKNVIWRKE
jgi:hypothetical protein